MDNPRLCPKGGYKQRLAKQAASESANASEEPSNLVTYLIQKWSWGLLPAVQVQEICMAAVRDGTTHPELKRLSTLGSNGKFKNHCHRDLVKMLRPPDLSLATSKFKLPMAVGRHSMQLDQHFCLPHAMFAAMYENHPEYFGICMGTETSCASFWKDMASHPHFREHPIHDRHDFQKHGVPISLHGDGVPVAGVGKSWSKSCDVYSWSSLLARGMNTLGCNLFIFSIFAPLICTGNLHDTYATFWRILCWSLHWLGLWPDVDPWGNKYRKGSAEWKKAKKPLASGFFGALWVIKGDLDWCGKILKLPQYNSLSPCAFCPCNTTTMPWTDWRKDAALWVRNIWDNRLWAAAFPDCHPLFKLEGVGILALGADLMHIKHLGTDQYFLGSVLHLLVYSMMPGIAAANLEEVWRLCLEFFSQHRVTSRFANLKLSMFVNTVHPHVDYPKLKGKAAEMRSLGPALHHVWCNKMDGSILIHRQVELALRCCADIDTILDDNRDVVKLPPGAATKFQDNVFNFLSLLNAVATHFTIKQVRLFNLTIKCHYLAHIGFHAEYINPRLCWCYAGEDLMNKVKVLTQSCLKGTHASKVSEKLLPKYMMGLHLSIVSRSQWFARVA